MSSDRNPFRVTKQPIHGRVKRVHGGGLDGLNDLPDYLRMPEYVDVLAADVRRKYAAQSKWIPIAEYDRELLRVVAANSDELPSVLIDALARALGVMGFAIDHVKAWETVLYAAEAEISGKPITVAEIARLVGVAERKVAQWRTAPEYPVLLHRAKLAFEAGGAVVGPGGLPYPGDDWLDPDDGLLGWEAEVEDIAQELIERIELSGQRRPESDIRRAAYTMVAWHSWHGRPLGPTVIKMLGYALGLVNHAIGQLTAPSDLLVQFGIVASDIGHARADGTPMPSVRALAASAGVSRPTVDEWLADPRRAWAFHRAEELWRDALAS